MGFAFDGGYTDDDVRLSAMLINLWKEIRLRGQLQL